MDRQLLRILLKSGTARKFDVSYFTRKIAEQEGENGKFLFETSFLNTAILFKYSIYEIDPDFTSNKPVKTLVYTPYDHMCPQDGGESFIYSYQNYN